MHLSILLICFTNIFHGDKLKFTKDMRADELLSRIKINWIFLTFVMLSTLYVMYENIYPLLESNKEIVIDNTLILTGIYMIISMINLIVLFHRSFNHLKNL